MVMETEVGHHGLTTFLPCLIRNIGLAGRSSAVHRGLILFYSTDCTEPWNAETTAFSYLSFWKKEKEAQQIEIINFQQRLECYHIHYTLFHLHIHTARQEEKEYHHIARWAEKNLI